MCFYQASFIQYLYIKVLHAMTVSWPCIFFWHYLNSYLILFYPTVWIFTQKTFKFNIKNELLNVGIAKFLNVLNHFKHTKIFSIHDLLFNWKIYLRNYGVWLLSLYQSFTSRFYWRITVNLSMASQIVFLLALVSYIKT